MDTTNTTPNFYSGHYSIDTPPCCIWGLLIKGCQNHGNQKPCIHSQLMISCWVSGFLSKLSLSSNCFLLWLSTACNFSALHECGYLKSCHCCSSAHHVICRSKKRVAHMHVIDIIYSFGLCICGPGRWMDVQSWLRYFYEEEMVDRHFCDVGNYSLNCDPHVCCWALLGMCISLLDDPSMVFFVFVCDLHWPFDSLVVGFLICFPILNL